MKSLHLPISDASLRRLFNRYGVTEACVFGSYARGDASPTSDLDLLIDLAPDRGYLDLGGLQYELEQQTGKKVDVVLKGTVRRRLRPAIEKEKVKLQI